MPNAPCQAPVSWVITTGDGRSQQFACDRHRDAILAKVTTAHRVLRVADWLANQPAGAPDRQAG